MYFIPSEPVLSECNESKGFAPIFILIGVVILVAVTGGAYFLGKSQTPKSQSSSPVVVSPTPQTIPSDETVNAEASRSANWKTYTNQTLGITFKYPPDINISESNNRVHLEKDPDFRMIVGACPGFSFGVSEFEKETNYQVYLPVKRIQFKGQAADFSEKEDKDNKSCLHKIYFINQFPSNEVKPRLTIAATYRSVNQNLYDQILSTFKFLDQNQQGESGIIGKIVLGPSCPAVGLGMENECQDKPYQATVVVRANDRTKEITRFTSDAEGSFKVNLVPGNYLLESVSSSQLPFLKPKSVTVEEGKFTSVTISYDTGIR